MTKLTSTPGWDDVPQLETSTIALGGPGGPMNSQAQALLNRTEQLKLGAGFSARAFGARPGVVEDQSSILQAAWDASAAFGVPFIVDGVFWIDLKDRTYSDGLVRKVGLQSPSNSKCVFAPGAAVKILPNSYDTAYGICTYLADNVEIWNPVVYGERDQHAGTTGEWGHCFNIVNCTNVYIHRPVAYNPWGDGVYVGIEYYSASNKQAKDITIFEPRVFNPRRNGISLTSGINIKIMKMHAEGVNGVFPQAGIDIEPEGQGATPAVCENWRIESPTTKNCVGAGISVYTNGMPANSTVDIEITAHHDNASGVGVLLQHGDTLVGGHVSLLNPRWENNKSSGLVSKANNNGPRFTAHDFVAKNCGENFALDWQYSAGVCVYRAISEGFTATPGNFDYRGRVLDTRATKKCAFAVYSGDDATTPSNSMRITNAALDITESTSQYAGRAKLYQAFDATCPVKIAPKATFSANVTRDVGPSGEYFSDVVMSDSATANLTVTLGMRQPIRALKMSQAYSFVMMPLSGARIWPIASAVGKGIYSNDPGASVNLYPTGANDWIAEIVSGAWAST